MNPNARAAALLALDASQQRGSWSDDLLKRQVAGLDSRDAALAAQLCFGVLQHQMLLDFYLSAFSHIPLKRMETKFLLALRLGLFQMLYLDRIPQSAAVDQSVELVRIFCKNRRATGMANAILRNLQRNLDKLPSIPEENLIQSLSIRYSHPAWLVEKYRDTFGIEDCVRLLQANNTQPPIVAQVNTLKTSTADLEDQLEREQVIVQRHPWLEDCLILSHTGNLETLPSFQAGLFYIQDAAARLSVLAAGLSSGWRVLDACAAPGGKSFAAAVAMGGIGMVLSCDLHSHKIKRIEHGIRRLGLSAVIHAEQADSRRYRSELEQKFHCVLVDAPCSGFGVIRKKPDIRYKSPREIAELPAIQTAILNNVCHYVRPDGILLYTTCTLFPQENSQVVTQFLNAHANFSLEPFHLPDPVGNVPEGWITLRPDIHGTDGFFIAKMRRKNLD